MNEEAEAARTFWHIAHPRWEPGQPLRSRNALTADGMDIPWLWDEAPDGTDCDLVCLFTNSKEGQTEARWLSEDRPTYTVVRVDLPDDIELTRTEWEPYPAVRNEIPAEYLTVVDEVGV